MAKQVVTVELFYSGVWNVHTADVLTRDEVEITHGRADESGQPPPAQATLTFTGWDFNPRNPASPLFGLIGRNTPIRVNVTNSGVPSARFIGEVASWTPRQSLGGPNTPPDRWVEVVAAGLTRRLGQGADPLEDVLLRWAQQQSTTALRAYWPLSDQPGSLDAQSGVGGSPLKLFKGSVVNLVPQYGQGVLAPFLPPGMRLGPEVSAVGALDGFPHVPAGGFAVDFLFRADQISSPDSVWLKFVLTFGIEFLSSGNWDLILDPAGTPRIGVEGPNLNVQAFDHDQIWDSATHHLRLRAVEASGNNATWTFYVDGEVVASNTWDIGTAAIPEVNWVSLNWVVTSTTPPGTQPIDVGQFFVWGTGAPTIGEANLVYRGYAGEHAGNRIDRLCDEEDVPLDRTGAAGVDLVDTAPMGPQHPDGFLDLLRECADTDGGILEDARGNTRQLRYVNLRNLYSQAADLALDYDTGDVAPPLDPTVDDQQTRNDITVARRDGGSARATLDTGPLSTLAPPDGVGRVSDSTTVNVMGDGMLGDQAGWRLHLGTTDETRYPQVSVDLTDDDALAVQVGLDVNPGRVITIANLPPDLSPDLARLMVQGWTETIGSHRRRITFNCTPEEPFHIAEVEHADYSIIGSDNTTVRSSPIGEVFVAGTDTTLYWQSSVGGDNEWDGAEPPFDILVAGVRLTVTALVDVPVIADGNAFTVVQTPVNGVTKTIPSGTPVDVFHKSYIGL